MFYLSFKKLSDAGKTILLVLPSSAKAPVQLNWAELAIFSLLNSNPPGIVSK